MWPLNQITHLCLTDFKIYKNIPSIAFGSGGQVLERDRYGHMVKMYEISENHLLYINSRGGDWMHGYDIHDEALYLNYEIYDPSLGIQAL